MMNDSLLMPQSQSAPLQVVPSGIVPGHGMHFQGLEDGGQGDTNNECDGEL